MIAAHATHLAPTNKCLAQSDKSSAGGKATKTRNRHCAGIDRVLMRHDAKSIARHLGLTLRKVRSGDYRVSCRDGDQTTAYYTQNLEDAVNAAVEIARQRAPRAEPYGVGR